MIKKNFVIPSPYDKVSLKGFVLQPKGEVKGVVLLVHGMCEYKERYLPFGKYLCAKGYVAACFDQRGHGESVSSDEDLGWFRDTEGEAFVEDVAHVVKYLKASYPHVPFTLFGHSMGSMIVRCYAAKYDDTIDKLVVCGSPSKNVFAGVGVCLAKGIGKLRGERYRSKFLSDLAVDNNDKKFKGEPKGAWLSGNFACTEAFYANPKGNFRFTCNGFENLFQLMRTTYKKKSYLVKNSALPIYFISGDCDAVAINDSAWRKAVDFMSKLGYKHVTCKLYKGLRHEILNEPTRKIVYEDVLAYLDEKTAGKA